ncbi:unnamed protein product [Rhodiola kirilowii]
MESAVKKALKSLCCGYGWTYGVLWRFDQHNPTFLTLDEAFEDQIRGWIDDMLLQVHILGQGLVGEAAFSGKDQWIHSEAGDESLMGVVSYQDNEVGCEFSDQFSSGIKTVVAIPLESHGVVQFGSTNKMPESLEFLNQTKKLVLENINIRQVNASMPLHCEDYGSDQWLDSLFSNGLTACRNQVLRPSGASDELTGEIYDSLNIIHLPGSVSKMHHETVNVLCADPDVVLSEMMPLEQLFPSETTPSSAFVFPPFTTATYYNEESQNFQDSHFASTYNIEELLDVENSAPPPDITKSDNAEISSSLLDSQDEIMLADWPSTHSKSFLENDAFQWPGSTASSLNAGNAGTPANHQAHQVQRNVIDTFSQSTPAKLSGPSLCLAQDFEGGKGLTPPMHSCPPTISSCKSGITELEAICASRPRKGLFSELGLEQLLGGTMHDSASMDRCNYDDPYSTSKRRKTGSSSTSGSQIQSEVFSCLSEKVSSFHHHHKVAKPETLGLQGDVMMKPQAGLWIDDSYSINAGSTNMTPAAKRAQESIKPIGKRAKPGESTRPRPKDRQQFQDRLGELRKMIPNTGKCSIDALLDSTIKHMLFLQNLTKYAEKLKRISDQKEKKLNSKNNVNGVTWAFELCDQAMICPIKVEDVGPSGQLLIEMLCDNGVTFLEIADTIRGFGLSILNGSMEDRNDKTWAYFIVEAEASRSVTRVDVFWSLAQHLQQTTTSGINSINQLPFKAIDSTSVAQSEYRRQPNLPQPILADTHR